MTDNFNVRQMRAQYTTYPLDTDQIDTLPQCTRIPPDDETQCSDDTLTEPIYESPLTEVTLRRPDKARPRKSDSGKKGPRAKTNDIYALSCDPNEINRAYSGYSYVSRNSDAVSVASTVGEHTLSTPPPQEGGLFSWTNPIAITEDENTDYAEIPIRSSSSAESRPRSRVNEVYTWDTYSAVDIFRDIGGTGGKRGPRKRKRRWQWYTWFTLLLAVAALVIACWAFIQSHRALSESSHSERLESKTSKLGKNESDQENMDDEQSSEASSEAPKVDYSNLYNEMKTKIESLSKNYSKLLDQLNNMKQKDSSTSQILENIKVQVAESNSRYSKANVSLWQKLKDLKGPRGYNGTQGDIGVQGRQGPQGPQGQRGLSIKNCTHMMIDTTDPLTDIQRYAAKKETKKEKLFDISCDSNVEKTISEKIYDPLNSLKEYTCTCTAPEDKANWPKTATCTIKFVVCQLP